MSTIIIIVFTLPCVGATLLQGRQTLIQLVFLLKHLYLSGSGLMWLQEQKIMKRCVFKRDWTACSKYYNHSRLNNRHN